MAVMQTAPKIKFFHLFIIVAILTVSLGGRIYASYWPKKNIAINGLNLKVLVADTDKHRRLGMGGRDGWGNYQGMLFVYSDIGQHAMVMRDMRVAIDIIWIDDGKIVDMVAKIEPEVGYKEEQLTPYFSRLPSTMVLELPAGFIDKNQLKIGDSVLVRD